MAENVDITLLARLGQDTLAETRAIRTDLANVQKDLSNVQKDLANVQKDLANVQVLAIKTVDVLTKMEKRNEARAAAVDGRFAIVDARLSGLDQRIGDIKEELGLTIKSELIGALGNFEVKMAGLIEDRLARRD